MSHCHVEKATDVEMRLTIMHYGPHRFNLVRDRHMGDQGTLQRPYLRDDTVK